MATSPPLQRLLDWLAQVKSDPVTYFKVFIRWHRHSMALDSDPDVIHIVDPDSQQALIDAAVQKAHSEAELRLKSGGYPDGATHYEVVVETIVQVSQFKVAIQQL